MAPRAKIFQVYASADDVSPEENSELTRLQITPNGEIIGRERKEPRFSWGGVVFLHCPNRKPIRASGRDLSLNGIGIELTKKLKSYSIGSRLNLEFAQPHHLQGMLIPVELRRVRVDENGHNQIGFKILTGNNLLAKRLRELILAIERSDPWAY